MTPRRLIAGLLVSAALAEGALAHRDAIRAEGSAPAAPASQYLSRHDPPGAPPHLDAILRVIPPDTCWACQWHKVLSLASHAGFPRPAPPRRSLALLPPRSAANVARFTRHSRGPPALL